MKTLKLTGLVTYAGPLVGVANVISRGQTVTVDDAAAEHMLKGYETRIEGHVPHWTLVDAPDEVVTKEYEDGTVATGTDPLPEGSPESDESKEDTHAEPKKRGQRAPRRNA